MLVEAGCDVRKCASRLGDDDRGHLPRCARRIGGGVGLVDDHHVRSAGDRALDERMAVGALAAQRDERAAWHRLTRIGDDARHGAVERPNEARTVERGDEPSEWHGLARLGGHIRRFDTVSSLTKRGPAGRIPACIIAIRAIRAKTGAATAPP